MFCSVISLSSFCEVSQFLILFLYKKKNLYCLDLPLHTALLLFLRQVSSHFSVTDVQEMDAIVSSFNAFETKEAGPLILTWAVFLCLISSLPGKEENNVLLVCGLFFF